LLGGPRRLRTRRGGDRGQRPPRIRSGRRQGAAGGPAAGRQRRPRPPRRPPGALDAAGRCRAAGRLAQRPAGVPGYHAGRGGRRVQPLQPPQDRDRRRRDRRPAHRRQLPLGQCRRLRAPARAGLPGARRLRRRADRAAQPLSAAGDLRTSFVLRSRTAPSATTTRGILLKPSRPRRVLLLSLACSTALAAQAQAPIGVRVDVPAGDLATALDTWSRQSGTQLVYRADLVRGARSAGVRDLPADQALDKLLRGSGFSARRDGSGAVLIVQQEVLAQATGTPAPASMPARPPAPAPAAAPQVSNLEAIQVTGSRIARAQIEGPAPITVISAEQIRAAGLTSVPDVLRSLSQNSGSVQGQQNTTSAQSTPGAQAVDLRGLGPNHTLVLINGRRIADFPLPLNGRSNFTDIGNIPLGMIDRIEVLTGSASAVCGSDAMAGVINFILRKSTDGTTLDYRYGDTDRGGGESHSLTLTSGFDRGDFTGIVGIELIATRPLWGFDRDIQDSTLDAPTERRRLPRLIAQVYDWDDDVNIAPADGCAALGGLNEGTTDLAEDRFGEPYCGSDRAIAYRTITNQRTGYNAYGSFEYRFSDALRWFADVQLGRQEVKLLTGTNGNDVASDHMGWEFHDPASESNYRNK